VKVVPLTRLLPTAKEWATKICEKVPLRVQRAKEAITRGLNMALEDGLSLEQVYCLRKNFTHFVIPDLISLPRT